jgi:transcriptional regulator with XRE-family HTH domain
MARIVVDVNALYEALDAKRDRHELSWREVANQLDLSPSTFTRMAQGQRPDIDAFTTLLDWLEMPAEKYARPVGKPQPIGSTRDRPLVEITTLLRSSQDIERSEADALNDIIAAVYKSIVRD